MANRYLITGGGSVVWNATETGIWSETSGGATGASVPGASDAVIMDAASGGGKVTLGYDPTVTSITMGAFTGEFDISTYSPTMATFDCSGTGTRTLTMTNMGTMTLTGNNTTIYNTGTVTNLTLNTGGTIDCTYSGSTGTRVVRTGSSATYGIKNLKISAGTDSFQLETGTGTTLIEGNLDFTGFTGTITGDKATNIYGNFILNSGITVTRTSGITMKGTSAYNIDTKNVALPLNIIIDGVNGVGTLQSDLQITTATKSLTLTNGTFNANNYNVTATAFSSSNSNVRTLTMGSGTWTLTGSNTTIWTTSTNTNLTLNAGTSTIVCNYSGGTGTRTVASGGTAAYVNNFNITAGTDTFDFRAAVNNLDTTGFKGVFTLGGSCYIKGNLLFDSGMTTSVSGSTMSWTSTTTSSINTNGVALLNPVTIDGVGGVFTLASDLDMTSTGSGRTLTLTNGTFNANNKNVSVPKFASSNSNTRTLTMGSGNWNLTGTGTVWNTSTSTNLTVNKGTAPIRVLDDTYTTKTLTGGGTTYYKLYVRGPIPAVILTDINFDIYFSDAPITSSVFPKGLPRDMGNEPIQDAPAPYRTIKRTNSSNQVASSVITLDTGTTNLEVGAFGGQGAVIRWIPKTETDAVAPYASVVSSGLGANYDHYIPPSEFRRFAIPMESNGMSLNTATGINRGTYQRVAVINAGITASSILLAEY